jgi:hypothetical protein
MGRPKLVSLEGPALRRPKVASREGVMHRPEFIFGMLPASVKYLDSLRKLPRGKSKALCDAEQRVLDACLWLEALTGKPRIKSAIVAALANLPHVENASDWITILCKRGLVDFARLTIKLRAAGRAKANPPTATPTIDELHRIVIDNQSDLYARALKAVIDHYPETYSRAELAAAADLTPESFAHGHAIRSLSRQGLIVHTADGRLVASAALFPAKAMS